MSKPVESFFDFDNEQEMNNFNFWQKPKGKLELNEKDILYSGSLLRFNEDNNKYITNYFVLTFDYFFIFKSEKSDKILAYIDNEWVRTDFFEEEDLIQIRFIKNRKYFDLFYADEKDDFEEWKKNFSKVYNQCDFHFKYKNIKLIGKGSYARVYLVENVKTKQKSAVKAFRKSYLLENQNNCRFALKNEIHILRRLQHKNIMQLQEVHESKNSIYMVLELLEGGELLQFVSYQPTYTLKDILFIMKDILSTLEFIHENKIMHRDLKPENILLQKKCPLSKNQIKLVDFGLATRTDIKEFLFKRCGTPGYVAPEIINCQNKDKLHYGPVCDIFSAGVIFYILLTERSPFEGSFAEVIKQNKECKINFNHPSLKYKDIKHLLKQMLMKDPNQRITAKNALKQKIFQLIDSNYAEKEMVKSDFNFYREQIQFIKNDQKDDCSIYIREQVVTGNTDTVKMSQDSKNSFSNYIKSKKKKQRKTDESMLQFVLLKGSQINTDEIYDNPKFTKDLSLSKMVN